jgi:hypothetical protein
MRSGPDRCAAILDLIDRCLAGYDGATAAAPPHTSAMRDSSMHDVRNLHRVRPT